MEHHGEEVIVRGWGGVYLIRCVWAAHPWAVEIMGDRDFEARVKGEGTVTPIPFPREDVFQASTEAINALKSGRAPALVPIGW